MARRNARAEGDDTVLPLTVATAVGSILVNIAQVIENQGTRRQAEGLRRQREHLIGVLTQWQKAYGDLKVRLDQRERELAAAHRGLAESRAEVRRQADELEALGADNRRLLVRVSELEAKGGRYREERAR
jgi:hypothetical protein